MRSGLAASDGAKSPPPNSATPLLLRNAATRHRAINTAATQRTCSNAGKSSALRDLLRSACSALRPGHGPLQLGLAHRRAALDAELLGVVVELFAGAAAGSAAGALAAAAARGPASSGAARGRSRLPRSRLFLVHGARRDLLGTARRATRFLLALLDVLVLASSFGAFLHSTGRHRRLLS